MANAGRGIKSIEVSGRVLSALMEAWEPMMLRDIAEQAELKPALCHAYLTSMKDVGLVHQDPATGLYHTGHFAIHLGVRWLAENPRIQAAIEALHPMASELGVMAFLSLIGPLGPAAVHIIPGPRTTGLNLRLGDLIALTSTTTGRVFAAFSTDPMVQGRADDERTLLRKGDWLGASRDEVDLDALLDNIRETGLSATAKAPLPSLNTIAAPVHDPNGELEFAITLIGGHDTLSIDRDSEAARRLCALSARLRTVPDVTTPEKKELRPLPVAEEPIERDSGRGVRSIYLGTRLLHGIAEHSGPMMLRDVAASAGVETGQAHAYIASYRNIGLVEQIEANGRYRLGRVALYLGMSSMRMTDPMRLASDAAHALSKATRLNVAVAIWGSFGPNVVQVHESGSQISMDTRPGTVYSMGGTATGLVYSAYLSPEAVRDALERETFDPSDSYRVGARLVPDDEKLDAIRAQGYATVSPGTVPGVCAFSAPVFDHTGQIALALTIIGRDSYILPKSEDVFVPMLLKTTRTLSADLGYTSTRCLLEEDQAGNAAQ
ncbi:IclR family transcriptional regulator [Celeribacter sp.]|uniref:IclR family transcriptional regulator n=1 Tax=Celeribacter sp. TaxID=1890673 RepID=UPI003A8E915C